MPAEEVIRPSTRGDIDALGRAFEEVFGTTRSRAMWEWKYFDNPRGTFSFVCEADGRIVAHCGGTAAVVRDGTRRYVALQSVDFLSSRTYAGGLGRGGVFYRLVDGFFSAYCGAGKAEMVYGFPGERHRMVGEKILGYVPVEPVGQLSLQCGSERSRELEPLDSYLALLSQERSMFGVIRDREYLDWRYVRHPEHRYSAVSVRRWPWRKPRAVAVVRETASELLVLELEGDYRHDVLERMALQLQRGGKPVRMWGSLSHERSRSLIRAGFNATERPHQLETRFFFSRPIPQPGDFYYSLGDYDVE